MHVRQTTNYCLEPHACVSVAVYVNLFLAAYVVMPHMLQCGVHSDITVDSTYADIFETLSTHPPALTSRSRLCQAMDSVLPITVLGVPGTVSRVVSLTWIVVFSVCVFLVFWAASSILHL